MEYGLYNIMTLHTIWNQEYIQNILGPGAVYFSVIRDPSEAFESMFSYFKFKKRYNIGFEEYVQR